MPSKRRRATVMYFPFPPEGGTPWGARDGVGLMVFEESAGARRDGETGYTGLSPGESS